MQPIHAARNGIEELDPSTQRRGVPCSPHCSRFRAQRDARHLYRETVQIPNGFELQSLVSTNDDLVLFGPLETEAVRLSAKRSFAAVRADHPLKRRSVLKSSSACERPSNHCIRKCLVNDRLSTVRAISCSLAYSYAVRECMRRPISL